MANISVTYTFSNGSTADATEVNTNFQDIIDGTSDGTKDFSISALTVAGTATLNGNVNLGNATSDDITFTGRIASDLDPKTAASNTLGDATQTWQALYLDNTATDGGAIYFDGGSNEFIKMNAAGTQMNFNVNAVESLELGSTEVVFNDTGADIDFRVEGDTEANLFVVDASTDRVGIGVAAPSSTFTVQTSGAGQAAGIELESSAGNRIGHWYESGTNEGSLTLRDSAETAGVQLNAIGDSTISHPAGNGTTLELNNLTGSGDANKILLDADFPNDANVSGAYFMRCQDSGGIIGSIRSNGAGVDFNTTSDARLKSDIKDFPEALPLLENMRPVEFLWTDRGLRGKGFIAQDLHKVYPEAVSVGCEEGKEEYDEAGRLINSWSVDHSKLVPVLAKAIQELAAKVEKLEQRV